MSYRPNVQNAKMLYFGISLHLYPLVDITFKMLSMNQVRLDESFRTSPRCDFRDNRGGGTFPQSMALSWDTSQCRVKYRGRHSMVPTGTTPNLLVPPLPSIDAAPQNVGDVGRTLPNNKSMSRQWIFVQDPHPNSIVKVMHPTQAPLRPNAHVRKSDARWLSKW